MTTCKLAWGLTDIATTNVCLDLDGAPESLYLLQDSSKLNTAEVIDDARTVPLLRGMRSDWFTYSNVMHTLLTTWTLASSLPDIATSNIYMQAGF